MVTISGTAITHLTTTCPDEFLGVFDYVSNITTSGECNGTGSVDVCSDTSKISFNYTSCSIVQAYSG